MKASNKLVCNIIILLLSLFACSRQSTAAYTVEQNDDKLFSIAGSAQGSTTDSTDYEAVILSISKGIEQLKNNFPQLKDFNKENVSASGLFIDYSFKTHTPKRRAGWTGGVPEPDNDGVWFYIDFHSPDSQAQIDTQPIMYPHWEIGEKRVTFLILEGSETQSITGEIFRILRDNGINVNDTQIK